MLFLNYVLRCRKGFHVACCAHRAREGRPGALRLTCSVRRFVRRNLNHARAERETPCLDSARALGSRVDMTSETSTTLGGGGRRPGGARGRRDPSTPPLPLCSHVGHGEKVRHAQHRQHRAVLRLLPACEARLERDAHGAERARRGHPRDQRCREANRRSGEDALCARRREHRKRGRHGEGCRIPRGRTRRARTDAPECCVLRTADAIPLVRKHDTRPWIPVGELTKHKDRWDVL